MAKLDRIVSDLRELSAIGATPEGGTTRLGWSPEERAAHALVGRWMEQAGLRVWVDAVGNSFGRLEGKEPSLPAITLGSHLDTVKNGGNFDGALGVVGAVEALRSIKERGLELRHPAVALAFAGEEAARFTDAVLGSRMAMGQVERSDLDRIRDSGGLTLAQAMEEMGFDPDRVAEARWDPARIAVHLELHIEQGSLLESQGRKIGVVTAIAAATRYRAVLTGRADHSGATPMGDRLDALAAAAEIVLGVERIAEKEAGPTTVGTVCSLKAEPGVMTIIPGRAEMGIDVRDTDPDAKRLAVEKVKRMIEDVCLRRGIDLSLERIAHHEPARMSATAMDAMDAAARRCGYEPRRMPSAAGHDARIVAFVAPTGMIFVPSREGLSHSPKEWTEPGDLLAGVDVLEEAVIELDRVLQ